MTKNKLKDLNNHLFAQLERLNDETLQEDKMRLEIEKSRAMSCLAQNVITNARLILDAHIAIKEWKLSETLPLLGIDEEKKQ